jgi:branched-chain amino acid transport system ATP-binding protein
VDPVILGRDVLSDGRRRGAAAACWWLLGICDRVVVLEFGRVIAASTPEVVRDDPRVIGAYLGGAGARPPGAAAPKATGPLASEGS